MSIDLETNDPDLKVTGPGVRRKGYITGISFAVDRHATGSPNCPAFYLPIRHQGGGNYSDPQQVLAYFRDQAAEFDGELTGANLPYDLDYLAEQSIEFKSVSFIRDVQNAGALLLQPEMEWGYDEGRRYLREKVILMNLDAICSRLDLPGKDETQLNAWAAEKGLNPKSDMWRAHSSIVAPYAIQDARAPLTVLKKQTRQIAEQNLETVWDLESRLLPVLLRMRRLGVKVNLDKVDQIDKEAQRRKEAAATVIGQRSGMRFDPADINKAVVIAEHLAKDGVICPLTEKSKQPSVKSAWLDSLDTPIAAAIKECRKWDKLQGTFCQSIRTHQIDGRLHCTFNQLKTEREDGATKGVGFGRLSSDNLNIQQQPGRDPEIGPLWRSIYEPDEGGEWLSADISSQEPRWTTAYAAGAGFPTGIKAAELCRTDPNWDNHSMVASMMYGDAYSQEGYLAGNKKDKQLRGNSKTIGLGLAYGMGGGKLCRSLGLPTKWVVRDPRVRRWTTYPVDSPEGREVRKIAGVRPFEIAGPEGKELLELFDRNVPHIKQLAKLVGSKAKEVGYVRTALGRRCRFPRHPDTGRIEYEHKALNRLVQGTSADQMKLAMVQADAEGFKLQLQVHDELDMTIWDRSEATRLAEIMSNAIPAAVPFPVDIEIGPNWGEIK